MFDSSFAFDGEWLPRALGAEIQRRKAVPRGLLGDRDGAARDPPVPAGLVWVPVWHQPYRPRSVPEQRLGSL